MDGSMGSSDCRLSRWTLAGEQVGNVFSSASKVKLSTQAGSGLSMIVQLNCYIIHAILTDSSTLEVCLSRVILV